MYLIVTSYGKQILKIKTAIQNVLPRGARLYFGQQSHQFTYGQALASTEIIIKVYGNWHLEVCASV